MFWADKLAEEIGERYSKEGKPLLIRDEKTVSGRVHVGSMRGVAIHGAVCEALTERGITNTFAYELNDFDVFDSAPEYLPREFENYVGMLLKDVPSPESTAANFAEYYGKEFENVIVGAGWKPDFYWGSSLYLEGKMDNVIREALEGAGDIRRIYKEISGSQKGSDWYPLSVVCEACKKIMTTRVTAWDGKEVSYTCTCGKEGATSPFGGRGKLPWKVEWSAKWKVLGVKVEGGGKDHSTRGGARDVANHISKEVFGYEPPFDMPYEFFLVGGQKMSSSKGKGSSAREISELVPTKIFRLALLGKDIMQAINFDPAGDTIPVLYDQYDKLAENYWSGAKDDYARLFEFIHLTPVEVASKKSSGVLGFLRSQKILRQTFSRQLPPSQKLPRFSQVAFVVQMPHLELEKEFPEADKAELKERAAYAKRWLNTYAPEKYVFKLQETLPEAAGNFSQKQIQALQEILRYIVATEKYTGEELHQELHAIKDRIGVAPQEMFKAIYFSFLGRESGPQAGWFLAGLDKKFVVERLREAARTAI